MGNKTGLEKKENGFHSKDSDPDLKKLRKSGSTKKVDSKKTLLKDSKRKVSNF
jgi:hypothetical protein